MGHQRRPDKHPAGFSLQTGRFGAPFFGPMKTLGAPFWLWQGGERDSCMVLPSGATTPHYAGSRISLDVPPAPAT
jgi:hypothetical protein